MKTLSIQQPWATLICSGIKDVENRTWKAAAVPGKILIHAGGKKIPQKIEEEVPIEWASCMENARKQGWMSEYNEMPTSAIIGYVEVIGFAKETESVWDGGKDYIKWQLKDAYLFDEPISDVKGKLSLFDYPLDENNLPKAHQVILKEPFMEGEELVMPLGKAAFDRIEQGERELMLDLTDENVSFYCPDENTFDVRSIKTIRLEYDGKAARYQLEDYGVFNYIDKSTEQPIIYKSLREEDMEWVYI
ncbi:MAG: ASCH domain-containing protein, partial [Bacteroides sp.]